VLSRLLAYRGDPEMAAGQQLLWRFAEDLLPRKDVGAFNQALMELGSEVCTPRSPKCTECPVAVLCPTREQGVQGQIPPPKRKPQVEEVTEAVVVIRRHNQFFLRQRGEGERWSGLWDFPRFPIAAFDEDSLRDSLVAEVRSMTGLGVRPTRPLATLKHGVTRFRITLHCYEAVHLSGRISDKYGRAAWLRPSEFGEYPLSVTGRKISEILRKNAK
jgi:A/G-specific adenine glycosylase